LAGIVAKMPNLID